MSEYGNVSFFDSCIVRFLQEDSPFARKTIQCIVGDPECVKEPLPYRVRTRSTRNVEQPKQEVDVSLERALIVQRNDCEFVLSDIHIEVEAKNRGVALATYLLSTDVELSINNKDQSTGEYIAPETFVIVLKPRPKSATVDQNGICERSFNISRASGEKIVQYTYKVKYLDDTCRGTLMGPIWEAYTGTLNNVVSRILGSIREIQKQMKSDKDMEFYERNMLKGLLQRLSFLRDKMYSAELKSEEMKSSANTLDLILSAKGEVNVAMTYYEEAKSEGYKLGIQRGVRQGEQEYCAKLEKETGLSHDELIEALKELKRRNSKSNSSTNMRR